MRYFISEKSERERLLKHLKESGLVVSKLEKYNKSCFSEEVGEFFIPCWLVTIAVEGDVYPADRLAGFELRSVDFASHSVTIEGPYALVSEMLDEFEKLLN